MGFQKTVLIIALVILSISIIVLSIFISRKDDEKTWPPESSTCPPYYDISNNDTGTFCIDNNFDLHPPAPIADIADVVGGGTCGKFYVQAKNGTKMNSKQKCEFVQKCKVNWEGWCEKPSYSY